MSQRFLKRKCLFVLKLGSLSRFSPKPGLRGMKIQQPGASTPGLPLRNQGQVIEYAHWHHA
ncbi:hypothetical protein [Mixta gaviniae]|uniref:hypothetical protein n=1 Tax=Mixta gaviniae TaxID=665914 RepID=UPI0011B04F90|nr:hypothetical protein [Mixta gaviniae]